MIVCRSYKCEREAHPDPKSKELCGDCWREREEHTEYEKRWYAYWNAHGKNYIPEFTYPDFAEAVG